MDALNVVGILRKRFWIIVSIITLGCTLVAAYSVYFVAPSYMATTKLIVNKSNKIEGNEVLDLNSINTSIMLVNTYKEIILASAVLDRVVNEYPDLATTQKELLEKIKVRVIEGTQVITVTVKDASHARSVQIVNAIAEVFKSEIPKIMKVDNVTILNATKVSDSPNPTGANIKLNLVLAFVAFGFLSVGIVLIRESLDDTFKSEQDLQTDIGLPVLASIRNITPSDRRKNESRGHSSRRGGETNYAGIHQ